jgi:ribosomal-protein-alanine N-acetyltransferase
MAVGTGRRITLRQMTARDLDEVRRIERAAYTDAWSRRVFEQELRNGFAHYLVAVEHAPDAEPGRKGLLDRLAGRLLAPGERLAGFAGAWFMVDQLHLVTIAVAPARQGTGLGARLLLEVIELAREAELGSVVLEVRVSNERAQRLYERYGFRPTGRLRDYYKDNHEDALVMQTPPLADAGYLQLLGGLRAEHRARYPELWGESGG